MMVVLSRIAVHSGIALCLLILASHAQATSRAGSITTPEAMSMNSTLEAFEGLLSGIQLNLGNDIGATFAWQGTYSSTGATFSVTSSSFEGLPLSLSYAGALTTAANQDMDWSGSWTGTLGSQSIAATDTHTYVYDSTSQGYSTLNVGQSGLVDGPFHWFLRAVEVLVEVAGAHYIPWTGKLPTGNLLFSASDWVESKVSPPTPPSKPSTPSTPPPYGPPKTKTPTMTSLFDPTTNSLLAQSYESPVGPLIETTGRWGNGSFSGQTVILSVPEPGSWHLLASGLGITGIAIWLWGRRPVSGPVSQDAAW